MNNNGHRHRRPPTRKEIEEHIDHAVHVICEGREDGKFKEGEVVDYIADHICPQCYDDIASTTCCFGCAIGRVIEELYPS